MFRDNEKCDQKGGKVCLIKKNLFVFRHSQIGKRLVELLIRNNWQNNFMVTSLGILIVSTL